MDLCVLEACPYRLSSLSSQLITEPFFIITATMSEGWEASAYTSLSLLGETKMCKMDNRLLLWLKVGLISFYFLLLTRRSCEVFCVCVCFVQQHIHSFVNRLSKDLVGAAVQAQL